MNASICRISLIAVAAAGALAAAPAFAAAQAPAQTVSATRAPQKNLVKFRGRITPSRTGSTSAAACPDSMRAVAQTSGITPFNASPTEPIVVVPASAFASGQFPSEVQNATAHAQLARACAK